MSDTQARIIPGMHRLLVELIPDTDEVYGKTKKSPIIAPEGAEQANPMSKLYRVLEVGSGEVSTRFAKGDLLFLADYSVGRIIYEGNTYFSITEPSVVAKLDITGIKFDNN